MDFLGNRCLLTLHFVERCKFRISITNIEKENNAMNMLAFDMITDLETFKTLFKEAKVSEFEQRGMQGSVPVMPVKGEIMIPSVMMVDQDIAYLLEPIVSAFEELIWQEFGRDIDFSNVVIDQKSVVYQIRAFEAVSTQNVKLELWYMFDFPRKMNFQVNCMTLYDVRLKKHVKQQLVRSHTVAYTEFNNLFAIKKHELDRSQLVLFANKYLETLKLHMPTMAANKGEDEDSDYEELIQIAPMKLATLANSRKLLTSPSLQSGGAQVAVVTA